MGISTDFETYGLLNAWQRRMQEDIWRFNQIEGAGSAQLPCGVYNQPDRQEIADSLDSARRQIAEYLGYHLRPTYVASERIRLGRGAPWQLQELRTKWKHLSGFGSRAVTLIQANVTVTYSDSDGDGVDDTATITATTDVDASEIQIFFRTTDGAPAAADARWRIEPVHVTKSGNTATIVGHRALFTSYTAVWDTPFDPPNFINKYAGSTGTVGDFVTAVDVYRVYTDTTDSIRLLDDNFQVCCSGGSLSSWNEQTGLALVVQPELGTFRVRLDTTTCYRFPEWVEIDYLAGAPLVDGQMDRQLEIAAIKLANTLAPKDQCSFCDRTQSMWNYDREPMPAELLSSAMANNPFGIMRGQIDAWRIVFNRSLAVGGKL